MVRNIALGITITIGMALTAPVAVAQQKHHVSYDTPATQTTYTQQHIIDVGDIPGHQARLFEIRRTYGNDAPLINGSKLKEQWTRGMSDYIDNNGPAPARLVDIGWRPGSYGFRLGGSATTAARPEAVAANLSRQRPHQALLKKE